MLAIQNRLKQRAKRRGRTRGEKEKSARRERQAAQRTFVAEAIVKALIDDAGGKEGLLPQLCNNFFCFLASGGVPQPMKGQEKKAALVGRVWKRTG